MINIAEVLFWKFPYYRIIVLGDTIKEFPGGIPSQSLQDEWRAEYVSSELPTLYIHQAKLEVNRILEGTDWYVSRKSERDVAIPDKVIAFRAATLAVYTALKSALNAASDEDEIDALYVTTAGASNGTPLEVDGTDTDVVSTSNNTITSNGHGYVNDELVTYDDGQPTVNKPIKGLASKYNYYIIAATTNTFKLSLTPSFFGDEAVVSLTGVADAGTAHTFTSLGKPAVGVNYPNETNLAYKL